MPQTTSPRWLILPTAADSHLWEAALKSQAAKAGLRLVTKPQDQAEADLVLVADANLATTAGASPDDVAILLSQAGPLPEELATAEPNPARHSLVTSTSELMRRACEWPEYRFFTARAVSAGPVALFEDFRFHFPEATTTPVTARNAALVRAFEIYSKGEALWSPDMQDIYATVLSRDPHRQVLDATGKPRFAVHGPYMTMPAGQWKAVMKLEFSKSITNKVYRVDWGGLQEFSQFEFRPEKVGLYEIELDWTWDKPAPCEVRVVIMEGIFDGELTVHETLISRID